jgi:hypothetical protein
MATIPTGEMERELRKRYLRFVSGLTMDSANLTEQLAQFEADQFALIESMGGRTASLGALGDFPAPKSLDLSPWTGTVYQEMQTTAIKAGIIAGSSSLEAAQAMFRAGMDKSFHKLERLARTETTNAYWKNAWGSIADLPLLVMIWSSEGGPRTCAWCRERDGLVMDGPDLRDHPSGRCTPIPTLRSQVQYRGSISRDGQMYHDAAWKKTQDARIVNQPVVFRDVEPTLVAKPQAPVTVSPAPEVKTFGSAVEPKVMKARISEGDWRYIDDRDKRAVTLLQNDYRAEKAVKKAATNLRNGADPMQGVAVPKAWSKNYTGHVTDVGVRYTEQNVRDAIEDAARWLVTQEEKTPRMLYKGLDVPKEKIAKLFKVDGTFDTNYSSFTTDEDVARKYSSFRGTQQVIVRTTKAPAVPISGNPTADHWKKTKEHLVTGQGRITRVVDTGRTVYVDVEF